MLPSQQDPNTSQPASSPMPGQEGPQPYASVPEFLHMEPVLGQPEKKKKSKKPLLILGIVVFVTIIAGIVAWFMLQLTPQQRFYVALENGMNTSYIKRNITVSSTGPEKKLTAVVESNFLDLHNPITKLTYRYSQQATANTSSFTLAANITRFSNSESYAQLSTAPSDILNASTQLNEWYRLSGAGAGLFDVLGLSSTYNSPVYLIPIGNFDITERQQIIDDIKSSNIYILKEYHDANVSGVDVITYKVQIDAKKLNSLAKAISDKHGSVYRNTSSINDTTNFEFTVNKANNRIINISYDTKPKNGDGKTVSTSESFSYPDAISIERPASASVWKAKL